MPTETTATRAPLSRARVLEAALRLIDAGGVGALSMRRLGAELGVEAMSLYNHVEGKDAILDGVVELLWGEIAHEAGGGGDAWQERARRFAGALRRVAHRHPHAFPLLSTRGVLPPPAVRLLGELADSLREAGFGERTPQVVRILVGYACGQSLAELTWYRGAPAEGAGGAEAMLERCAPSLPSEEASLLRTLLECDPEADYRMGLEALIEGVQVLA